MLYESKVSINPPELKSESSEQLYKNDMDLKNSVSKVAEYRGFFVSKYLNTYWNSIILTGVVMKPPKYIKYVLVKCNSFIKLPIQIKVML